MPARYGQHFLRAEPARQLLDLVQPKADDTFLEIGPGTGVLTFDLARQCRHVVAIEIDPLLLGRLRERANQHSNVTIVHADALIASFRDLVPSRSRLLGNLPYAISSPLLRRFLDHSDFFQDGHLMLQREVAERVASPPGSKDYGILSVLYALWADVEIVQRLGPEDFSPAPRVDSAVIRVRFLSEPRAPIPSRAHLDRVLKMAFAQRRRTLANNMRLSYPDFKHHLKSVEIAEVRRAETLTALEFARLAEVLPNRDT